MKSGPLLHGIKKKHGITPPASKDTRFDAATLSHAVKPALKGESEGPYAQRPLFSANFYHYYIIT